MRGGGGYMDKFPNEFKQILEGKNPWNSSDNDIKKPEKMPENKTELMAYLDNSTYQREINNWNRSFHIWSKGDTMKDSLDKIKAKINEIDP
jgi:hypothetical protein